MGSVVVAINRWCAVNFVHAPDYWLPYLSRGRIEGGSCLVGGRKERRRSFENEQWL